MSVTAKQKLVELRALMSDRGLAAYFVPSSDPHQSEYPPSCWQRREWLTGFTGSAGDVLVAEHDAGLWTDGRYYLQAEAELGGSGIRLFRAGTPKVPTIEQHLIDLLSVGDVVGVDPRVVSVDRAAALEAAVTQVGARLELLEENLIDRLWVSRPPASGAPIQALPVRFSGESVAAKLRRVRRVMKERGASAHVVTTLDAIAWLFNIRGVDVEYNPVAISYALVTDKAASLFIDPAKVPPAVRARLQRSATVLPYARVESALRRLARRGATVWIDPGTVNRWVVENLGGAKLVAAPGPVGRMKAAKNPTELAGMRAAHVRDGVAMVRFLRWLEGAVRRGGVTEMGAAEKLESIRARGEHFKGLSFPTIAGYGAHGAIIHYRAESDTDAELEPRGLFLLDSGAQYLDGTTDITRTVSLGPRPSRVHRDRFTRVLKGHIALATARFPAGCSGARLDTLARTALWDAGLDYAHGTGHGVGAYLNVHEGPQSISFGRGIGVPLEVGNIQSNEPGYYKAGEFGIRIENLVEVVEDGELSRGAQRFLRFDTLTLCPIDQRLLDRGILTQPEVNWFNDYHARVARVLGPRLGRADRDWLNAACRKVGPSRRRGRSSH